MRGLGTPTRDAVASTASLCCSTLERRESSVSAEEEKCYSQLHAEEWDKEETVTGLQRNWIKFLTYNNAQRNGIRGMLQLHTEEWDKKETATCTHLQLHLKANRTHLLLCTQA